MYTRYFHQHLQMTGTMSVITVETENAICPDRFGSIYYSQRDTVSDELQIYKCNADFNFGDTPPLDEANQPILSTTSLDSSSYPYMFIDRANNIHCIFWSDVSLGQIHYATFDTTAETWGTDTGLYDDQDCSTVWGNAVRGVCDSEGDIHLVFLHRTRNMGVTYDTLYYSNNVGGGFKTPVELYGATAEVQADRPATIYMSSDTNVPIVIMPLQFTCQRFVGNTRNATSFTNLSVTMTVGSNPPLRGCCHNSRIDKVILASEWDGLLRIHWWDASESAGFTNGMIRVQTYDVDTTETATYKMFSFGAEAYLVTGLNRSPNLGGNIHVHRVWPNVADIKNGHGIMDGDQVAGSAGVLYTFHYQNDDLNWDLNHRSGIEILSLPFTEGVAQVGKFGRAALKRVG